MKILVCGGRDFDDYLFLTKGLDYIAGYSPITHIVTGGASGADALAERYGKEKNIPVSVHKAEWHKYGKAAGPKRNQRMLDEEKPDYVVAFPGGRGTTDMVRRARDQGFAVIEEYL